MKRIGIVCDGGDAPGINATIRAVARASFDKEFEVLGFIDGFHGLIENDVKIITKPSVSGILTLGGSILGISRFNPYRDPKHVEAIKENFKKNNLTLLVFIGDRDTVSVARKLSEEGVPSIVVPKSIDNDVYGTDHSIGFDTAVSFIASSLDNLHATASAHHRLMVVETMGRETGWLALFGGLAGGADYIVIPEVPFNIEEIAKHVESRRKEGKNFSIVTVAEGVVLPGEDTSKFEYDEFGHKVNSKRMVGYRLASELENLTHLRTRVMILGYLQRGGIPTNTDRLLATRLGVEAVNLTSKGIFNVVVGVKNGEVITTPYDDAYDKINMADVTYFELARLFF